MHPVDSDFVVQAGTATPSRIDDSWVFPQSHSAAQRYLTGDSTRRAINLACSMKLFTPRTGVGTKTCRVLVLRVALSAKVPFRKEGHFLGYSKGCCVTETTLRKDQRAGCFRISARACNRVESAALFVLTALFSNDGARLLSFASSFCFRCELSAF